MSDIFISYASEDKEKAGLLAKVFEQQGWSVWWDRDIPAGRAFDEVIEEALDAAKCVFVLWSKASVKSGWVKEEASEGNRRKILVPALIEDVNIPLGFKRIQAIRLVNWQGQKTYPELNKLIRDVEKILGIPRKVQSGTESVDSKEEEALKREKEKWKVVDKNADLQQYPEKKIETKPVTIERTETEQIEQPSHKRKAEEEKTRKPEKQRNTARPSTAKKRGKMLWLLPSIIVPLISVIAVFYLSNHKAPEEIVTTTEGIAKDVKPESVQIKEEDRYHDSAGFYTGTGLDKLLSETGELDANENVIKRLLLFKIDSQHTWLITTSKRLFCLLDDTETRKKGSLVQWKVKLDSFDQEKVRAYRSSSGNDVVDLGRRAPWLYSKHLHPNTSKLENEIRRLVEDALGLNKNMVLVKGGCFEMGDTSGDGSDDERPVHNVCVNDFYIGKYEVTQGQWKEIMGNNPSNFQQGDNYPVETVSWNEVQVFITKLNKQTGQNYRLPTEAEWEYAARGGTTTKWYCGDDEGCLDSIAWYSANSDDKTHPVGTKQPNKWGLYDMTGNVWEWCHDRYDSKYYKSSPVNDPTGSETGSDRVIRGGSWELKAGGCRSSYRFSFGPSNDSSDLGFRLVLPQTIR